jgi:hypothetical protein
LHPSILIKEVEEKYPVESIRSCGLPVWQFLRNVVFDELYNIRYPNALYDSNSPLVRLRNAIYNYNWGKVKKDKKYNALLFTDFLEERILEGKRIDKLAYNLTKEMSDNLLIILDPIRNKHEKISEYYHQNYISIYKFLVSARIKSKTQKIKNKSILSDIEKELKLVTSLEKKVNQFFCFVKIFENWFFSIQPQFIFINCYFSLRHQAIIYAANKMGIKTVELQHCNISKAQVPYQLSKNIGRDTFPDYLLSFGEIEKKLVSTEFIPKENIIPIGNFYLERMNQITPSIEVKLIISELRRSFDKIVLISSQKVIHIRLNKFLVKVCRLLPHIAFLLILRKNEKKQFLTNQPNNLFVIQEGNLYELCHLCDYHSTVFSTFAAEAAFMGKPNVFINIDNLSNFYYSEIFANNPGVKFTNTPEKYVEILKNWEPASKKKIKKLSKTFFSENNYTKIKMLFHSYLNL